jgi:hypothetical protein
MKRLGMRLALIIVLVFAAGCATMGKRQPELARAAIAPAQLKPGDTAIVTVQVEQDGHHLVHRIEGVVKDSPAIKFKLRDDGVDPDQKAGDGLWTLQVDVPFQAAPGDFVLELTAYRADGAALAVHREGSTGPLTATIPIIIRNP